MGKTIITHFLEGTPKGIQSVQISNKTIMGFVIPRADIKKAKEVDELIGAPSLYMLFGEDTKATPQIYIGQTDDFLERVIDHNKKKDFWNRALVFISQAGTLNKADVLYLEYLAINHAKENGNYNLDENKQNPKLPKLQRHTKDTLNDFFIDVKFITEFLNYSVFKSTESQTSKEYFYTTDRKSNAKGFYDENGFTVLKGSVLAPNDVKSFIWKEKRQRMLKELSEVIGNDIVLKADYTFSSPSTASSFCVGANTNGWSVWKNGKGKTLDEVFRK